MSLFLTKSMCSATGDLEGSMTSLARLLSRYFCNASLRFFSDNQSIEPHGSCLPSLMEIWCSNEGCFRELVGKRLAKDDKVQVVLEGHVSSVLWIGSGWFCRTGKHC